MGWASRLNPTTKAESLFHPAFLRACARAMAREAPVFGRGRIFIDTEGRQVRGRWREDGSIEWQVLEKEA